MRRQFAFYAITSLVLQLTLTAICHGNVAGSREDELESLAKRLQEFISEENREENVEHQRDGEHKKADSQSSEYRGTIHLKGNFRSGPGLTQAQKDKVIAKHNQLRKGENAADMQKLKYNEDLAWYAQDWADRCSWGHRPSNMFQLADFKSVGENLWAWEGDSKSIPDQPIQDWFDEKYNYDFDGIRCNKEPCGHYTAVVWASTREVGCGLAKCPTLSNTGLRNANYFVCNYGPGGNAYGQKPYTRGSACSACSTGNFFCTDGLCDASCRSEGQSGGCQCKANCGDGTKTSDCKCKCNNGAFGVSCNEKCVDKDPRCGVNGAWPEQMCSKDIFGGLMYDEVTSKCPKMCNKCVSTKREGEELELLESLLERMILEKK